MSDCKLVLKHRARLQYLHDHADDLGIFYDPKDGENCIKLMEQNLRVKSEGKLIPCVVSPWMAEDIIKPMFGWKYKKTGYRMFKRIMIEVGKKNWKTGLAAGLLLYSSLTSGEGQEGYCSSVLIKNARRSFEDVIDYIKTARNIHTGENILKQYFTFNGKTTKSATIISAHPEDGSLPNDIMLLSRDNSQDGMRPGALSIVDEVHAAKNISQRDTIDTLVNSASSIQSSQILFISTAGTSTDSLGYELHRYGCSILDGAFVDNEFLFYSCTPDKDIPWDSDEAIRQANPNLGVSVRMSDIKRDMQQAIHAGGFSLLKFKAQKLNTYQSGGNDIKWLDMDLWNKCRQDYSAKSLKGRDCFVTFDMSKTTDLTSVVALFPPISVDEKIKILCWNFLPRRMIDSRREAPFKQWCDDGYLTACNSYNIDDDQIYNTITDIRKTFNVKEIGYDRNFATNLKVRFEQDDVEAVPIKQNDFIMSEATKKLEILIGRQEIAHNDDPVLNWTASNARIYEKQGGIIAVKKMYSSSFERVDSIVALIMAIYLMEKNKKYRAPTDIKQIEALSRLIRF